MEICAKTELEFLPNNCRACPLNEQFSPNVDAKCRILRTYMHDGSNERPTKCPLKAKAEGVFIDCTAMDKLPGGCEECEMGDRYGCVGDVYCRILNDYFTGNVTPPCKERPDKCPLMEVPHKSSSLPTYADFLEMDGDPVFITLHQNTDGEQNEFWALVHIEDNKIYLRNRLGECLKYEEIEADVETISAFHGISAVPITLDELTEKKDEVVFLKWKDDEEVYGEFVLVTKYRPSGINYLCADGSTGRERYVMHDEDWFVYRLGCNQDAVHEIKNGKSPLSLEELKTLSSAAGPAIYTQPVFIKLKLAEDLPDGTWDGSLGFAAVKFDKNSQFAKAWTAGNPVPFKLDENEYGRTWSAYFQKPDFSK